MQFCCEFAGFLRALRLVGSLLKTCSSPPPCHTGDKATFFPFFFETCTPMPPPVIIGLCSLSESSVEGAEPCSGGRTDLASLCPFCPGKGGSCLRPGEGRALEFALISLIRKRNSTHWPDPGAGFGRICTVQDRKIFLIFQATKQNLSRWLHERCFLCLRRL